MLPDFSPSKRPEEASSAHPIQVSMDKVSRYCFYIRTLDVPGTEVERDFFKCIVDAVIPLAEALGVESMVASPGKGS